MRFAEFDASLMPLERENYFCWHPRNPGCAGCWAKREDAQMLALPYEEQAARYDVEEGEELPAFWMVHAGHSIPLYAVARVVGLQEMTRPHYEDAYVLEFDYGNMFMQTGATYVGEPHHRIGFLELSLGRGWRLFDSETEYQTLLVKARQVYDDMEASIDAKIAEQERR